MNQKERIGEAQKLFNLLYGGVTANKYGYLWTFPAKKTYSFDVSNAESRLKMAEKAIWLNDELEQNVFFGVVLTDTKLDEYHRVSIKGEYPPVLQPAIWADLDIKGENHKADNLPPDAKTAISLLPFKASIVVNSGGGLHAYNLLDKPLLLNTYEERKNANKRNNDYLDMIRANGEGKYKIDGTADLPRVLRVPGTYNLKNIENPVLCHIVEVNESVRYSLNELNHLIIPPPKLDKSPNEDTFTSNKIFDDNNYQWARAVRMLDFINADDYDEWIKAGTNIKQIALNLGIAESKAFEAFKRYSAKSAKFDLDECLDKWEELPNGDSDSIKTLFRTAERGGYDEKSFYKEWNDTQIAVGNERYKELRADNMKKSAQNELDDDFILGDSINEYYANDYDKESEEIRKYAERKTGFETLDKNQKIPPALIVIGAESGIGKTTFCYQLVEQIVQNNPNEFVIYVSYEMSRLEMFAKSLTRRTKLAINEAKAKGESFDIPITDFQARKGGTNATVKKIRQELTQPMNLRVYEATAKDNITVLLEKLKKSIDNIKRKNPAIQSPIVVIDYLQIMPHDKENHKLGIDGIILKLKTFQRETKTTFIVISSVNRMSYDKDKNMAAFKETGSIEFSADVALIMNKENDNKEPEKPYHVNLKCLKNRFGAKGYAINFDFYGKYDLFVENGAAQQSNSNKHNDIDDWDAEAEEEKKKNG